MRRFYERCRIAVIGAGPYGLALGSHLRGAGVNVRVFGKAMDFWHSQMPAGMLLRSPIQGSSIADPDRTLSLPRYLEARPCLKPKLLRVEDFVRYGHWFQRQALPDLDSRALVQLERLTDGFCLTLEDGERILATEVVVAAGIASFAHRPEAFALLRGESVTHTSDPVNRDLVRLAGKRIVVVGCGQSALESAALLSEAGAEVLVLARQPQVRFLRNSSLLEWLMDCKINPFRAPGKIGPIGVSWLVEHPRLFTALPRGWQNRMSARAIRPAGSSWLRPRTASVRFRTGVNVVSASNHGAYARLCLSNGEECDADHVLLGTGYAVDIARYRFFDAETVRAVRAVNGYPILNGGFESSVPGLYFVGSTAAHSFGPLCRFVAGTRYAARALTRWVVQKSARHRRVMVNVDLEHAAAPSLPHGGRR